MAVRYDFEITAGTAFSTVVDYDLATGDSAVAEGSTILFAMRKAGDPTAEVRLSKALTADPETGEIALSFSASETAGIARAAYAYAVTIAAPESDPAPLLWGFCSVGVIPFAEETS